MKMSFWPRAEQIRGATYEWRRFKPTTSETNTPVLSLWRKTRKHVSLERFFTREKRAAGLGPRLLPSTNDAQAQTLTGCLAKLDRHVLKGVWRGRHVPEAQWGGKQRQGSSVARRPSWLPRVWRQETRTLQQADRRTIGSWLWLTSIVVNGSRDRFTKE